MPLTKVRVVEKDKLLPAVLGHHLHDDLVEIDGRAHHQGVVVGSGAAAGGRAGRARRAGCGTLNVEMRDMHGVGQRLQAALRHAADGADQGQDAAVHELACCRKGREADKVQFDSPFFLYKVVGN